jgi:hypothetical protein
MLPERVPRSGFVINPVPLWRALDESVNFDGLLSPVQCPSQEPGSFSADSCADVVKLFGELYSSGPREATKTRLRGFVTSWLPVERRGQNDGRFDARDPRSS